MSEAINELAKALAIAQKEIKSVVKEHENPFFKSKYADLSDSWEVCREPLSKNGLCVVQTTYENDRGLFLVTRLLHSSGQWISAELPVRPEKNTPQALGSALTYMRRYGFQAMVGISAKDDDGEASMSRNDKVTLPKLHSKMEFISEKEYQELLKIATSNGWNGKDVGVAMKSMFGKDKASNLFHYQYDSLVSEIKANPKRQIEMSQDGEHLSDSDE